MASKKSSTPKVEVTMIHWADACASIGWLEDLTDDDKIHYCTTVGKVIHEDDLQIVLAGTWSQDIHHNQRMAIPKGWIIARKKVAI